MAGSLTERADSLPTSSGVYLFLDRKGRVLYVGKAVNLRARVRQYVAGHDERAMVPFLVSRAVDVEVVVTQTEKEALLLENTLIKKHRPRFNVKLRDDSNFLHLRLDLSEPWPRYTLVRAIEDDGARYFGPYASASRARRTLDYLQRAFPLRTCTDSVLKSRTRPCLLHQMGRCVAPCMPGVDPLAYAGLAQESMLLLDGRKRPLIRRLRGRMLEAAEREEFEEAARLRDLATSIEATLERQHVVDTRLADRDVWAVHREGLRGAIALIPVREGVMGEPSITLSDGLVDEDGPLLSSLLNQVYQEGTDIPPEILVPVRPDDADALEDVLGARRGGKVIVHAPQRGSKVRLVEMATENARVRYLDANDENTRRKAALERVAEVVGLPAPPHRMECFDNSNIGGEHPVAAMSVFIDGKPDKALYRRYKVKTVVGSDDYATMREILGRRFERGIAEGDLPDLLVVDGGKGQLGVAMAVLQDLGLHDQPVIGISKPRTEHARGDRQATDKLVFPHLAEPMRLEGHDPALRMLQHLRDEVHAHAVRYHRKVRGKATLQSVLEGLPGIGPSRRRALLSHLGSAAGVLDATPEALAAVPGIGPALARSIHEALHPPG